MFLRMRPPAYCCVRLLPALLAVACPGPVALAEGTGLSAAIPTGAAFAAPALALLAGYLAWRAVRLLGVLLGALIGAACVIIVLMLSEGRLDVERLLAPVRNVLGAG